MRQTTVLYVDAGATAATVPLRDLVVDPEITVYREPSVAAATAFLDRTAVDCLVTEYDLPDGTGLDLVASLRASSPDTGAILVTDASPARIIEETTDRLVAEFVPKGSTEVGPRVAQLVKHTAASRCQTSYPIPETEQARLEALAQYDLDDERLQRAVKRVTALAADHFGVSRSSVNIIGEQTQTFLASTDGDIPPAPREDSVCTYSILRDDISVIEDTATDPRFTDNEASGEGPVRFYAAATLTTPEGYPLGTLCIYDEEPRAFTEADRRYFAMLAADVIDWLEVARRTRSRMAAPATGESL